MDDLKKAVNAQERLIDGNELMEWLKGKIRECVVLNAHAEAATTEEIIRYVKHMPAVDAVPVVHGRWIYENEGMGDYSHCSECGCRVPGGRISDLSARYKFCPNCGAKMHGERRDGE